MKPTRGAVEVDSLYTALGRAALIGAILLMTGCESTKIITNAIVASCGTSTVYLNSWFARMPNSSTIQFDPMGGYVFAYWIDDQNNVCHGNPGINGHHGPAVIKAFKPQAHELAINQSVVTPTQLRDFQDIPVSYSNYDATGLHFIQFYNNLIRVKSDGKGARFSPLNGEFSIPNIIDIGSMACMAPVALRVNGINSAVPLPNLDSSQNIQDPDKCMVRAMPTDISLGEQERIGYDYVNFQHAADLYDVP